MMARDRIIAVGLLTQTDIDRLGHGFQRLYPVRDTPCYGDLLRAIDEADRALASGAMITSPPAGKS